VLLQRIKQIGTLPRDLRLHALPGDKISSASAGASSRRRTMAAQAEALSTAGTQAPRSGVQRQTPLVSTIYC
jgi:hypothetical protein